MRWIRALVKCMRDSAANVEERDGRGARGCRTRAAACPVSAGAAPRACNPSPTASPFIVQQQRLPPTTHSALLYAGWRLLHGSGWPSHGHCCRHDARKQRCADSLDDGLGCRRAWQERAVTMTPHKSLATQRLTARRERAAQSFHSIAPFLTPQLSSCSASQRSATKLHRVSI